MRAIRKKSRPTQPLDIRLRCLLPLVNNDDAGRIVRISIIAAKTSLSQEDFEELKQNLIPLKPALLKAKAWYKALEEIGAEVGRDMATLRRLVGPGRPRQKQENQKILGANHDQPTVGLPPANKSITSRCQAAAEESYGRRISHVIRKESPAEFRERALREARAQFSSVEAGADPEAIQFVVDFAREFCIAPGVLLDAMNAR